MRAPTVGPLCVDRVGHDLGLFKNEHGKYELLTVPAPEDFPLVISGGPKPEGCGMDIERAPIHVRLYRLNGDVVIDETLEGNRFSTIFQFFFINIIKKRYKNIVSIFVSP